MKYYLMIEDMNKGTKREMIISRSEASLIIGCKYHIDDIIEDMHKSKEFRKEQTEAKQVQTVVRKIMNLGLDLLEQTQLFNK